MAVHSNYVWAVYPLSLLPLVAIKSSADLMVDDIMKVAFLSRFAYKCTCLIA